MSREQPLVAHSWKELTKLLYQDDLNPRLQRHRSRYVYRGLEEAGYTLSTSLNRHGGHSLEKHMLRNFKKYARVPNPPEPEFDWPWLALAQHHGLPTRLLDWTYSPFVAMHFATADYTKFDRDSAIYAIAYADTKELLPTRAKDEIASEGPDILTVDMLNKVEKSLFKYSSLSPDPFVTFFEPPSFDDRIVNQYAVFSFLSNPETNLEDWLKDKNIDWFKVVIPHQLLWKVRDRLDQANINERMLFPGLDGLAQWLKRHYKDVRT